MKVTINYSLSEQEKKMIASLFPYENVKLSYETVAPKKVLSSEYDVCMAIPYGKTAYLWYTYFLNENVCFLVELNRDNKIGDHISIISTEIPTDFELGTIVSGIIFEPDLSSSSSHLPSSSSASSSSSSSACEHSTRIFMMEDIHFYKGLCLLGYTFHNKSGFFIDVIRSSCQILKSTIQLSIPVFWKHDENQELTIPNNIPYMIKHIQYRSHRYILPRLNSCINNKPVLTPLITKNISRVFHSVTSNPEKIDWKIDINKPIFNKPVCFWVSADIAFDLYKRNFT
jgi:hypothetical protein